MKKKNVKKIAVALVLSLMVPLVAHATDADLQLKVDQLTKEVNDLKSSVKKVEDKSIGKWLTIGGDYRFRVDSLHGKTAAYTNAMALGSMMPSVMNGTMTMAAAMAAAAVPADKPKNESLYTNKFDLDLHAKATKDVTVNVKLAMYKSFGSQGTEATTGTYFADRVGVMDGTIGHVPSSSLLEVDRAYATWSNIAEQPVWFSVGRRPSTDGAPSNLRLNNERPGNGGTPALLVDYAFDGMTLGWAPDIDALPGAYAKICYGRGFDSGFKTATNSLKDTDMLGIAIIPVDTDPLRVWFQWNRGFNIFDSSAMSSTSFGQAFKPSTNLGDIDWYGIGAMSTLKKVGPGNINFFADFGMSVTQPNANTSNGLGMMSNTFDGIFSGAPSSIDTKEGYAVYVGARYDLPSKTKIGFEYNHGSKDWITFTPASDDMWTSKLGTRGSVYEPYIIQELNLKPISSYFAKAFFKLGYQYYDFEYTGSNNWVGAPVKISSIQPTTALMMAPVKSAHDVYATFEVKF